MQILALTVLLLLLTAAAARSACKPGLIPDPDTGKCTPCPAGTYRDGTVCSPCPAGTFNIYPGAHGVDICQRQSCPPNTFSSVTGAVSKAVCTPCPKGQGAPKGSDRCLACPAGEYVQLYVGKLRCTKCRRGEYNPEASALECLECLGETNADIGSLRCEKCAPGFGTQDGKCKPCGTEFNDGTTAECRKCPPGYVGKSGTADRCVPCPPGTFKAEKSGDCRPCPAGTHITASGASFCIRDDATCPINHFRNKRGSCQTCTKGEKYVSKKKKKACVKCKAGQGSSGGFSKKCVKCRADQISTPDGCVCRPGYRTLDGTDKCEICPSGRYSTDGTKLFCETCLSNSEVTQPGATECTPCPEGTFANEDQTECVSCPDGLVFFRRWCAEPQSNCPPKYKRSLYGDGRFFTCFPKKCPRDTIRYFNKYRSGIGKVFRCGTIHKGYYSRRPGNVLAKNYPGVQCAEDEVSEGGPDAVCKKCPKDLFQDRSDGSKCGCRSVTNSARGFGFDYRGWKDGKCIICPPGTRGSTQFIPKCIPCPAGSFQNVPGRAYCNECPIGKFTGLPGMAQCEECSPGTTNYFAGDVGCVTE